VALDPNKQFHEDVYGDYDLGDDDEDYLYDWEDEIEDYLKYCREPTYPDLVKEFFINLKWKFKNFIHLCRKCPDCGKRFGRHDYKICLPF